MGAALCPVGSALLNSSMLAAQQGAPLPLSPVIDTGLNIWTLASVLTARDG